MRLRSAFAVLVLVTLSAPSCKEPSGVQDTEDPVPSRLELVSGDKQDGVAGATLSSDLVVRVLDQYDQPLAGVEVTWTVTMGGGSLSSSSSTTDSQGLARVTWTLGPQTGDNTVVSRVPGGATVAPVTFRATALAGSASQVVVAPDSAGATALGDTVQFSATVMDASGNVMPGASVAWRSGDEAIATVDGSGRAAAIGNGTTSIVATADGIEGEAVFTISQVPTSVRITPEAVAVATDATQQLVVEVVDANGYSVPDVDLTWASSKPSVATVDTTGLVTGISAGSATITVSAKNSAGNQTSGSVPVVVDGGVGWEAPVLLFDRGDGRVAVDPGTGHLWAVGKNASNQLAWRKSVDEGATWSSPVAVAGGTTDRLVNYGSLAVHDGSVHLLTTPDPNGLTGALVYRRYIEATDSWNSVDLTANAGGGNNFRAHRASIATPDGTHIHVANGRVFDDPDSELDLTYHRSADGGDTWASQVLHQNEGARGAGNPDVAFSGSHVYVVFTVSDDEDANDGPDTRLLRSTDDGATWEADATIGESELLRPRIVAQGGSVGIVAETKANDIIAPKPRQMRWIESSDYGRTWPSAFTEFTAWPESVGHPVVSIDSNGGIHVAAFVEAGSYPTVYYWKPGFGAEWLPSPEGQVAVDESETNGHTQPYSAAASSGYVHMILGQRFTSQSDDTVYLRRPNPANTDN